MSEVWFFTFGAAHVDAVTGESLANSYVRIEADSEADARRIMCDRFGNRWSFCYPDEASAGVDEYGLIEIHLHGEGRPALPKRQPGLAYGPHPREGDYHAADEATEGLCG